MSMMWVGIGSAVVGLAGSVYSADSSKTAASEAANQNQANIQNTNAANLNLFNLSRGAVNPATGYGSAILPEYMGANEQAMGQSAYNQFNTLSNQANTVYGQQLAALGNQMPAYNASLNAVNNLYNGQNLQQQYQIAAPVYNANTNLANVNAAGYRNTAAANTNAINTGLAQQLAAINASNASQGFLGSSTFNNNRLLAATLGARQQAAVGQAQATAQGNAGLATAQMQNAQSTAGLQQQNLLNMQNTSTLGNSLSAYGQALSSPIGFSSQNYQSAQAPMNFFRIAPQAWQQQNQPTVYPSIQNGQIAGSALSGAGNSTLGIMQLYNQYRQQNQNPFNYTGYTPISSMSTPSSFYTPNTTGVGASLGYNPNVGGYNPNIIGGGGIDPNAYSDTSLASGWGSTMPTY